MAKMDKYGRLYHKNFLTVLTLQARRTRITLITKEMQIILKC